jgi:hypothetical protein
MKFAFLLFTLVMANVVQAETKLGVMASVLYNVPRFDDMSGYSNVNEKSEMSFGLGMRALMGIKDQLHFRSGAGFVQKKISVNFERSGFDSDATFTNTYLNIPLTLYWKASSQVGFFGGTSLYALLSDDFNGDTDFADRADTAILVLPIVLGFDFSFTEKLSLEISYEYGIMESSENLKTSSAVASFVYNI